MKKQIDDTADGVLSAFYAAEKLMPARAFAALIGVKHETEA
mgnify:CR=1 FL=1